MSAWAATTAAGKGIPGCALSVSEPSDFCMEWNAEGQLKRVSLNGNEVARFSYDPLGRRVEKVAGGVTTSYTYDGEDILRETRGATSLKYVHGPRVDEPLAREDASGAPTYYHADALGSVVRRTSQAGAVVHERRHDVWGNIEAGASEAGYSYTGREWEPEIGLHYYRTRYYDPVAGRFLSEDPIGFSGGENFYTYARNDPGLFVDPFGLRIYASVTVNMHDKDLVAATPCGTAGCTLPDYKWKYWECRPRGDGTWGFIASVHVLLDITFSKSPSSPSVDTPGLTLREHEELHVWDFQLAFNPQVLNGSSGVQTEGYCNKPECEEGRRTFEKRMTDYAAQVEKETKNQDAN